MASSLKLYFDDRELALKPIKINGKGFEYKGKAVSDHEPHYVYARSELDDVITLNVVAITFAENFKNEKQLTKILNSIKLTETNQTALKNNLIKSEKLSELVNENLLQGLPLPSGEWNVYQEEKEDAKILETRWVSKTSDDMVQTFILLGSKNGDVNRAKEIDNSIGRENCDKIFESNVLSDKIENGYQQLTWYTLCKTNSGFYSKAIHKSIAGNDSMYEIKRIFRTEPSTSDWKLWLDYMSRIKVCDSRIEIQACPSNLKRVR